MTNSNTKISLPKRSSTLMSSSADFQDVEALSDVVVLLEHQVKELQMQVSYLAEVIANKAHISPALPTSAALITIPLYPQEALWLMSSEAHPDKHLDAILGFTLMYVQHCVRSQTTFGVGQIINLLKITFELLERPFPNGELFNTYRLGRALAMQMQSLTMEVPIYRRGNSHEIAATLVNPLRQTIVGRYNRYYSLDPSLVPADGGRKVQMPISTIFIEKLLQDDLADKALADIEEETIDDELESED